MEKNCLGREIRIAKIEWKDNSSDSWLIYYGQLKEEGDTIDETVYKTYKIEKIIYENERVSKMRKEIRAAIDKLKERRL